VFPVISLEEAILDDADAKRPNKTKMATAIPFDFIIFSPYP